MDKWERELEEIGRTVDDSWDDQDPVQEENNFVNELSNMIHPIEIEKPEVMVQACKSVWLYPSCSNRSSCRKYGEPGG